MNNLIVNENKENNNKKLTFKNIVTFKNLIKLIATLFIFLMIAICIVTFVTGINHKFFQLKSDHEFYLFWRKNLAIAWTSIIFTIFTVIIAVVTNKLFLNCPDYKDEPNHPWFKHSLPLQIMDILLSLIFIILAKFWIGIIMTHSIDNLNNIKYFRFLNVVYNDEQLKRLTVNKPFLNIKAKTGNITTAFITLLFQRKLKNKLNYMVTLIN
jgi:hypothetical protein